MVCSLSSSFLPVDTAEKGRTGDRIFVVSVAPAPAQCLTRVKGISERLPRFLIPSSFRENFY